MRGSDLDGESHAWNWVTLDGTSFYVDVTWDDPTIDNGKDVCTHAYFGITEEEPSVKLQIEGRVGSSDKQRQQNIGIDCVLVVPHGTLELVDALPEVADVPQKYWGKPGVVMYPHGKNSRAYYKAR